MSLYFSGDLYFKKQSSCFGCCKNPWWFISLWHLVDVSLGGRNSVEIWHFRNNFSFSCRVSLLRPRNQWFWWFSYKTVCQEKLYELSMHPVSNCRRKEEHQLLTKMDLRAFNSNMGSIWMIRQNTLSTRTLFNDFLQHKTSGTKVKHLLNQNSPMKQLKHIKNTFYYCAVTFSRDVDMYCCNLPMLLARMNTDRLHIFAVLHLLTSNKDLFFVVACKIALNTFKKNC